MPATVTVLMWRRGWFLDRLTLTFRAFQILRNESGFTADGDFFGTFIVNDT